MFCTKCGAKVEDGAKFCVQCGNKMERSAPKIRPVSLPKEPVVKEVVHSKKVEASDSKPKKKIKVFPIILFVILLAAVLVFPKFILSGNEEREIITSFVDAEMSGDAEKLVEYIPDKFLDMLLEEEDVSKSEMVKMLDKEMENAQKTISDSLGENWTYSCKINSIKTVEGAAFNDIVDSYAKAIDNLGITEATIADVEISVSGKDIDNSVELEIPMIKIEDKWYLDFASFDVNFFDMSSLF